MDHIFDDIEPIQNKEELTNQDELLAKKLCTIDYLVENDLDNAFEILNDIEQMVSNKEEKE